MLCEKFGLLALLLVSQTLFLLLRDWWRYKSLFLLLEKRFLSVKRLPWCLLLGL